MPQPTLGGPPAARIPAAGDELTVRPGTGPYQNVTHGSPDTPGSDGCVPHGPYSVAVARREAAVASFTSVSGRSR